MAKAASFNFGFNKKPRAKKPKKAKATGKKGGAGNKSNAWRQYTGGGIPD